MKISYIPYKSDEMNDKAFSDKFNYRWSNILKKKLEAEGHEIHTYDITPFEEADAILSFDNIYFQNFKLYKRIFDCGKIGAVTHIDYEPPSANCKIHDDDGLRILAKIFKNLITYNDNVIGDNIIKGCIGDFFTKEQEYKHDFKKRKLLTVIANYRVNLMLFGQHPNELYSKRGEAVKYFQKKCPKDFDLYGNYWTDEYKKCYVSPVSRDQKQKVLSKYKFIISYDSLCKQNGYISEKIFDCFNAKVVPIYWGAENVEEYIPKECFIDKRDFESYDDLYKYIKNMSEETYEGYITAIEKYLHSKKYKNLFSSEASANILYDALMRPNKKYNKEAGNLIDYYNKKRVSDIKYNYDNNDYDYHIPNIAKLITFDSVKIGVDVDYLFVFNMTSSASNDFSVCYKVDKEDQYHEIKIKKYKKKNVYNGNLIQFKFSVFELIKHKKVSYYIKHNNKYTPLIIEKMFDLKNFNSYFSLYAKDNYFYKKIKFKDVLNISIHNKYFRFIVELLLLPFRIIKHILEIFYL